VRKWVRWPNDAGHPKPARSRFLTASAVLLQSFHYDPIQSPLEPSESGREVADWRRWAVVGQICCGHRNETHRGPVGVSLTDYPGEFRPTPPSSTPHHQMEVTRSAAHKAARPGYKHRCACSTSTPLMSACSGLIYAGVPMSISKAVKNRSIRQPLVGGRFRYSKIDHYG